MGLQCEREKLKGELELQLFAPVQGYSQQAMHDKSYRNEKKKKAFMYQDLIESNLVLTRS